MLNLCVSENMIAARTGMLLSTNILILRRLDCFEHVMTCIGFLVTMNLQ